MVHLLQLLRAMPVRLDVLSAAGIAHTVRTQLADHPAKPIRVAVGAPLLHSNASTKGARQSQVTLFLPSGGRW